MRKIRQDSAFTLLPPTKQSVIPFPSLSREQVENITYIGFTLEKNRTIRSKVYFRPDVSFDKLFADRPSEELSAFRRNNETISRLGARLYDCSFEGNDKGQSFVRAVWLVPFAVRQQQKNTSAWLEGFLNVFGYESLHVPIQRMDKIINKSLKSAISPLYLVGGYFERSGRIFKLKAEFDSDIVLTQEEDNHHVSRYDNTRSLSYLRDMLPLFLPQGERESWWRNFDHITKSNYTIEGLGIHCSPTNLDEYKIYFRSNDKNQMIGESSLQQLFDSLGFDLYDDYKSLTDHFLKAGWMYCGFNVAFHLRKGMSVRLYMQSEQVTSVESQDVFPQASPRIYESMDSMRKA